MSTVLVVLVMFTPELLFASAVGSIVAVVRSIRFAQELFFSSSCKCCGSQNMQQYQRRLQKNKEDALVNMIGGEFNGWQM